ncbi:HK97-gp10 family putative phage morphogenesis protein [Pelagerythrobacter marensis]|uniref:HK97-gp10 family putative phage morphogenesis protein n=1 Tax=Pelagerythrobacter marensis TaxID=543877 RepID=A0ABZ2D5F5_9SPHN
MVPELVVDGFEDALRRIRSITGQVHGNIGDNAMAALEPVAEDARRLAPVDSGEYRDSIVVADRLAGESTREGASSVYIGPLHSNVFYAWFLEFGTVNMPAYPVIIPAIEANRELVFEVLGERVANDILAPTI